LPNLWFAGIVPSAMSDRIQVLMKQLASDDEHIRTVAVRELLAGGAASVIAFCGLFCDGPSTPASSRAAETLKKLGREAVEPLVRVLKSGSPEAQVYAIVGLYMLREPAALEPLLEALENSHVEVRKAAIRGLWTLRDPRAVEPLIGHLTEADIDVVASVVDTLGFIGDRRAVGPLLSLLEDRRWQLRQAAAYALGSIGDERTLDAIHRRLFDPKPQVRKAVKAALTGFHCRKRRPPESPDRIH
jgi:HEAT repeat protein